MSAPEGIFESSVTNWLNTSVDGAVGPYSWEIIAGGHSNLTFLVTDANGRRLVLRRPPLAHGLVSAHDMAREHRIISALNRSSVPVPTTVGLCENDSINGAPFYVMEYVEGHVVRDVESAERLLSESARARASESLADTLAAIHEVDLVAVSLNDLGRHEDYLARQLRRWYEQWEQQRTRDLSLIDDVRAVLVANLPAQQAATIVHGDYRLDNTMVDDDGNVCAVLDWEICTLGDPLADIAMLAVYWTGPTDTQSAWESGATTAPGFWDRNQLIERYAQSSGRDLGNFDLYMAFANWKLACILEGVYARYLGGALGQRDASELEPFKRQVDSAARAAADLLNVN